MAKSTTTTEEAQTANAPSTLSSDPSSSPEQVKQAEKILEAGYVKLGGMRVNVYFKVIDELPRVKTEELVGREIIILEVRGVITSQEYGTAHRVVLAFADAPRDRLSWLCDTETVMGRQLTDEKSKVPL